MKEVLYLGSGVPPFLVGDCDVYWAPKDFVWGAVCVASGDEVGGLLDGYLSLVLNSFLTLTHHSCLSGLFVPSSANANSGETRIGMWVLCKYGLATTSRLGLATYLESMVSRSSASKLFSEIVRGRLPRGVVGELGNKNLLPQVVDALMFELTHGDFIRKYGGKLGVSEEFLRLEDYPFDMSYEDRLKLILRDIDSLIAYSALKTSGLSEEEALKAFRTFREKLTLAIRSSSGVSTL